MILLWRFGEVARESGDVTNVAWEIECSKSGNARREWFGRVRAVVALVGERWRFSECKSTMHFHCKKCKSADSFLSKLFVLPVLEKSDQISVRVSNGWKSPQYCIALAGLLLTKINKQSF